VPTASGSRSNVTTTVLVTAVSQADATVSGSAAVTVFPPNQNQQNVPIPLGVSGGNAIDSSTSTSTICCGGTLGALVSRGGNQYILGNSHVLARMTQLRSANPSFSRVSSIPVAPPRRRRPSRISRSS
jgi:hypothetical protein